MLKEQFHRLGKNGKKYWGKNGAGILFTDGNHILLLRRSQGSDEPNSWGIPGGRSHENEPPIDTAKRETKEETGKSPTGYRFSYFQDVDGRHKFTVYLYAVDNMFNCTLSKEHTDWKWIPIKDLGKYQLHSKLKASLPYYCRAISKKFPKRFSEWLEYR